MSGVSIFLFVFGFKIAFHFCALTAAVYFITPRLMKKPIKSLAAVSITAFDRLVYLLFHASTLYLLIILDILSLNWL